MNAPSPLFRDPPSQEDAARALRLQIAQALVRAPSLPVALPAFGMSLLDVSVDRRGVELVLGHDAPVAALRLERPRNLVALGRDASPALPAVVVRAIHEPSTARETAKLTRMAERVRAALTPARWEEAQGLAKKLAELPVGVPMDFYRQLVPGVDHPEGLVRTGFLCNQDCGICWQDRDWGRHDAAQILRWIEDLALHGARSLILSGGEPTLDPRLADYIRHARALGYTQVTLETNAVQLAKEGHAARLRDAGLTSAFVSLHSGDANVSDAITRAPGTHARTVRGVRALLEAGVPVKINAVMTREGLDHLASLPDFLHEQFGAWKHLLLGLMLSYPTQPYDPALVPTINPDPRKLRPVLMRTLERAFELGLEPHGLDGPCGPPLCTFGADARVVSLRPVPGPLDFRTHIAACARCSVKEACFGVRTTDVALYGEDCVTPL